MQSIARDSDDSSDEEFFDAHGNQSLIYLLIFGVYFLIRFERYTNRYVYCVQFSKNLLALFCSDSACISLTTDQFLSFPDTQHALGLQLK